MQVAELSENLAKRQESRFVARLGDLEVASDASTVSLKEVTAQATSKQFLLDEQALGVVSKFLKVPTKYVSECPPGFRAQTLNFWANQKPDVEVLVETVSGALVGMYPPGLQMIPVKEIGAMVERVFKPEDEIRQLLRDERKFHLDVTSDKFQVEVANPDRIPGRPEVGDITAGGIRFLATPDKVKAPVVSRYLHRLVCTNGMCTSTESGKVSIKGLTVPEIIASMEEAAQRLLSGMDDELEKYASTARMPVPGHPVSFAEQVGHEVGLPRGVMHNVLESVRQLPQNASVYDVNQAFTQVANETNYATRVRLQTLGGSLALNAPRMIERCNQCERLLVEG